MSNYPKIGSMLPGYEGGILTIHNIDGRENSLEVTNICDLSRQQNVR